MRAGGYARQSAEACVHVQSALRAWQDVHSVRARLESLNANSVLVLCEIQRAQSWQSPRPALPRDAGNGLLPRADVSHVMPYRALRPALRGRGARWLVPVSRRPPNRPDAEDGSRVSRSSYCCCLLHRSLAEPLHARQRPMSARSAAAHGPCTSLPTETGANGESRAGLRPTAHGPRATHARRTPGAAEDASFDQPSQPAIETSHSAPDTERPVEHVRA